jgi:hypothetical protein
MAEAWHLPAAPHDCTGPVVFFNAPSLNATNALIQESVVARGDARWFVQGVVSVHIGRGQHCSRNRSDGLTTRGNRDFPRLAHIKVGNSQDQALSLN